MRYLDLLNLSNLQNEDYDKRSRDTVLRYDHVKGTNEQTKKGPEEDRRQTASWVSPKLGRCEGTILDRDRGWLLVATPQTRHGFVWIKANRSTNLPRTEAGTEHPPKIDSNNVS